MKRPNELDNVPRGYEPDEIELSILERDPLAYLHVVAWDEHGNIVDDMKDAHRTIVHIRRAGGGMVYEAIRIKPDKW